MFFNKFEFVHIQFGALAHSGASRRQNEYFKHVGNNGGVVGERHVVHFEIGVGVGVGEVLVETAAADFAFATGLVVVGANHYHAASFAGCFNNGFVFVFSGEFAEVETVEVHTAGGVVVEIEGVEHCQSRGVGHQIGQQSHKLHNGLSLEFANRHNGGHHHSVEVAKRHTHRRHTHQNIGKLESLQHGAIVAVGNTCGVFVHYLQRHIGLYAYGNKSHIGETCIKRVFHCVPSCRSDVVVEKLIDAHRHITLSGGPLLERAVVDAHCLLCVGHCGAEQASCQKSTKFFHIVIFLINV